MPNTGSYAQVVQTFKKVLAATAEHAAKLPDVTQLREELQGVLLDADGAKTRQDSHTAARQATTQELEEILAVGRDLVMRLQFAAKLALGPRNEQLVQFGSAPLRGRNGKPKVVPPLPEDPAPEMDAESQPQSGE